MGSGAVQLSPKCQGLREFVGVSFITDKRINMQILNNYINLLFVSVTL